MYPRLTKYVFCIRVPRSLLIVRPTFTRLSVHTKKELSVYVSFRLFKGYVVSIICKMTENNLT